MTTRRHLALLPALLLAAVLCGCGDDDPAGPDVPTPPPAPLDLEICLQAYAAGAVDTYLDTLHPQFRFVPTDDQGAQTTPYDRNAESDLATAMFGGMAGDEGAVLDSLAVVVLLPQSDWRSTERGDPLGAHLPGAVKRTYQLGLRAYRADIDLTWTVDGLLDAYADTLGGRSLLLGLVDHTLGGRPIERLRWADLRRVWAEPQEPTLPISPDWLSLQLVAAHDNRDWLALTELLHPEFRGIQPDGTTHGRQHELEVLADIMAGRPDTSGVTVTELDVQRWESAGDGWQEVLPDDPWFGDVPKVLAQWLDIRIIYTLDTGETWDVDGLVRMAVLESPRGWRLLGFYDYSDGTGDEGSLGWWQVKSRFP